MVILIIIHYYVHVGGAGMRNDRLIRRNATSSERHCLKRVVYRWQMFSLFIGNSLGECMTPDLLLRSYKVADIQKVNVSMWKQYKSL